MPVYMGHMAGGEQNERACKKVMIHEPFPALNATDAFLADERTINILKQIFEKYKIGERYGIDIITCDPKEDWAMPNF